MRELSNENRIMFVNAQESESNSVIVTAIISMLMKSGRKVSYFKCGSDYIGCTFNKEIFGITTRNLDSFLTDENTIKNILSRHSRSSDIAVIEGSGYVYDELYFDSNNISLKTNTPEILIVDEAEDLKSLLEDIQAKRRNNIKGMIFNGISDEEFETYERVANECCSIAVLGFIPKLDLSNFEVRANGFLSDLEKTVVNRLIDKVAKEIMANVDFDVIKKIAKDTKAYSFEKIKIAKTHEKIRIAVARDKAFCFYYEDNIELLEKAGAQIVYFSPMNDDKLPKDIDGIVLCGGYPELFAKELSNNKSMLKEIANAVQNHVPTIAECGGYMYLANSIKDINGAKYDMVGALDANITMTNGFIGFGYETVVSKRDSLLLKKGEVMPAHQFHFSKSDNVGSDFYAYKNEHEWDCVFSNENLYAGYPHINFYGNLNSVKNIVEKCVSYKKRKKLQKIS